MLIVTTPFERVGKDIVEPLVQASSHHKFIIVLIGYTTRYPEAISLCNIRAEGLAWELAHIFTRTRIPKQVVTDQRTYFMSETLQALWQHLVSTHEDLSIPSPTIPVHLYQ